MRGERAPSLDPAGQRGGRGRQGAVAVDHRPRCVGQVDVRDVPGDGALAGGRLAAAPAVQGAAGAHVGGVCGGGAAVPGVRGEPDRVEAADGARPRCLALPALRVAQRRAAACARVALARQPSRAPSSSPVCPPTTTRALVYYMILLASTSQLSII